MTRELLLGSELVFAMRANGSVKLEKARELQPSNWGYKRVRLFK